MQGRKKLKRGEGRRRAGEPVGDNPDDEGKEPDRLYTSSAMPGPSATTTGERNTRNDPVPPEEQLTAEGWAIMTAVESCVVWKSLKSLNLKQREKLLSAVCLTFQEKAHVILQNQWDNILHHLMGITAAMEVWSPHEPSSSSSSSCVGENIEDEEDVPNQQTMEENSGTNGGMSTIRQHEPQNPPEGGRRAD